MAHCRLASYSASNHCLFRGKGLDVFMSSNFYDHHKEVEYNGYKLEHNHITIAESGKAVFDLSITKNVLMLSANLGSSIACLWFSGKKR
jgi:hypothetical protein